MGATDEGTLTPNPSPVGEGSRVHANANALIPERGAVLARV